MSQGENSCDSGKDSSSDSGEGKNKEEAVLGFTPDQHKAILALLQQQQPLDPRIITASIKCSHKARWFRLTLPKIHQVYALPES